MTGQAKLHGKRSNLGDCGRDTRLSLAQIPPRPTAASQRSRMAQGHADVTKCFISLTAIQHKQSGLVVCFASFGSLSHSSRKLSSSEVLIPQKHMCRTAPWVTLWVFKPACYLSSKQLILLHFFGLQRATFLHGNSPERVLLVQACSFRIFCSLYYLTLKRAVIMFSKSNKKRNKYPWQQAI